MVNSDRVKLTDKLLVNRPIMRRLISIQYRRYDCFDHHEICLIPKIRIIFESYHFITRTLLTNC